MRMKWILAACLWATATSAGFAQDFFFRPKDRVLFLGDSITEQYQYSTTIELYLTTRFPEAGYQFLNAGISGDTANGGANRFKKHVLDEKPTCVTINFGMNDGGYGKFDPQRQATYVKSTAAMLEMAQKAGVRVALVSPNAVDRRIQERFNLYLETQKEFYAPLRELAKKHGAAFVDQYATTRAAVEKMEADKATKVVPYPDGFHTGSSGGLLMAHAILTGLGAPALVSDAKIDVAAMKIEAKSCKVVNVNVSANGVAFDRTDDALPMPIPADWVSILPYVNNLTDLNRYGLAIAGLDDGNYDVFVDGKKVVSTSAKALAAGIDLGSIQTGPLFERGQKVFAAINEKNKIVHDRFRGVLMAQIPNWLADVAKERQPQELQRRLELAQKKQAEIDAMVRPQTHRFEVKRSGS